jgi:hypothetical protein
MTSSREWFERLTADFEVATVFGSIPASSDTVEDEAVLKKVLDKSKTNTPS